MAENDLAWKLVELLSGKMTESAVHELRHNPHSLEPFRAAVEEIVAVEREACAKELNRLDAGGDCEHNHGMDMETGEGLCGLDARGDTCLCGEINATLSNAQALIRARGL